MTQSPTDEAGEAPSDVESRSTGVLNTTIYLHIGTMKSGTTFIQRKLKANGKAFTQNGVLIPAATGASVVAATRDVLGIAAPNGPESTAGQWDDLRRRLLEWPGSASVVSMEFFSTTDLAGATRVVESLQPARVEIIITARDLARVIPSAWQESTQNAATWPFDLYLDSIVAEDGGKPGTRFWRQQDLVAIIDAWSSAAGPDHVHVVTVPPSGSSPDLLWHRFCTALGLRGEDYPNDIEESRANFALGHASAEFMRRFNEELRGIKVTKGQYQQYAKRIVAKRSLNQRKDEPKVLLPARYRDWVVQRSERMVDEIAATGVHVIGDLRDLVPIIDPDAPDAHVVTDDEVVDAAIDTIAVLLLELTKVRERGRVRE